MRRRRPLFLPRYLKEEGDNLKHQGIDLEEAHKIIIRWADLESEGHLRRKETALDADFLNEVFGEALGYKTGTQSPKRYHLERQYSVSGVGAADGALGQFGPESTQAPTAVIELKDAETDIDRDKFNGRTPVQQCWDYLNAIPNCPWAIVSNFVTFRLYHRDKTPLAFEHFTLQELRDKGRFREFYALFRRDGLVPSPLFKVPTTLRLLTRTDQRQREVSDELYETYSQNRLLLIHHLNTRHDKSVDSAIRIAQRIMDRIIFIAFCEDRNLVNPDTLKRAYEDVFPFAKATNPRWRNFLDLFHAMDKGHPRLDLPTGYDGGLFRHDPEVDDLQLDDEWTAFFREVSTYDFRDEINVDVLGHLFEKSITELEKLRLRGLFETIDTPRDLPGRMGKSAQRKRFGIYYTPAEFTRFIVENTLGELIKERCAPAALQHGVDPQQPDATKDSEKLAAYSHDCFETLRSLRVCDPACGSGAFLIQAYDLLDDRYGAIVENIRVHDEEAARALRESVPGIILSENLFGVDLSEEAVEITQLALWIRSARRGKTLADLSKNIVCGNSLVTDPSVDARAITWPETFQSLFSRTESGFDCVVSNPPWERLKLQEREFFSFSAPNIASAVSAAKRRDLIADLQRKNPELYARYREAKEKAESTLSHVRSSGEFPLTAKGDINTYALFAELARKIVAPGGRVGLLVPSGIATDNTTKEFFSELMTSSALMCLYDFENKEAIFADLHRSFKFSALIFGGSHSETPFANFVFFARNLAEIDDPKRHIPLTAEDLALLNPNTKTCPIFRSTRDAELTKSIYRRIPILIDESRKEGGNPWGIQFKTMFHQTNDAELFHSAEDLKKMRCKLEGNKWVRGKKRFLPLYEAKMVQAYDHRAAGVVVEADNWMRQGQTAPTSLVSHQNPEFTIQPRWWVEESEVNNARGGPVTPVCLSYKDVTSPTNERTMIAAFIPDVAVVNSAPLILTHDHFTPRTLCCLLANLNSFVLDYVARQKVGNVHLNFFIVKQFPMLSPDTYADRCPWIPRQTLEKWISDRVLKLSCTAEDMRPLGEACKMKHPVHKWKPLERAELMAELDAAYFLLYGISRTDAEYILSTFSGTRRRDVAESGEFRTADLILRAYDQLRSAT